MKARLAACAVLLFTLTACASPSKPHDHVPPAGGEAESGHGDFADARELAEPALHLASVDGEGAVHHLDLIDESTTTLAEIDPIADLVGDGRFLFGVRDGSVTVIDSGVWSWSHGDHFHYYEAPANVIGEIEGEGIATVIVNENGVGVRFEDEAVLLEQKALADGRIVEQFRVNASGPQGFVVPLSKGAVLADTTARESTLRIVTSEGDEHAQLECVDARGTIATVVGVVVGCADAALLSVEGDLDGWERIPYPPGATPASEFESRKGRPRVAAISGGSAIWVLDTRARNWLHYDIGEPVVRAAAVDDGDGRIVLLTAAGEILVMHSGAVVARTAPLVADSLADPTLAEGVALVVDQQRVYLNGPAEQKLWEISPADDARVTRTFDTQHPPLHLSGTGR